MRSSSAVTKQETSNYSLAMSSISPRRVLEVALMGSVRQPAIYEIRGTEVIAQLLEAGGGTTSVAAESRISIERTEDHAKRRADDMPWNTALTTELKDGDILRIDPIVSTFTQTVTLRGAVVNPGHFAWHEGMRLSELMPDRESLTKRDYWWHRTQLGISGPEVQKRGARPKSAGKSLCSCRATQARRGTSECFYPSAPQLLRAQLFKPTGIMQWSSAWIRPT